MNITWYFVLSIFYYVSFLLSKGYSRKKKYVVEVGWYFNYFCMGGRRSQSSNFIIMCSMQVKCNYMVGGRKKSPYYFSSSEKALIKMNMYFFSQSRAGCIDWTKSQRVIVIKNNWQSTEFVNLLHYYNLIMK